MSNSTFRLCAELVDALAEWSLGGGPPEDTADADLIDRARAALAQPEPVAVSDEELDELFTEIDQSGEALSWRAFARAVLARWGTPANNTREANQ